MRSLLALAQLGAAWRHVFGLQLPRLVDAGRLLSRSVKEIHETIGTVGYSLIDLHAAAALFHHYVVRDGTLLRMVPRRHTP